MWTCRLSKESDWLLTLKQHQIQTCCSCNTRSPKARRHECENKAKKKRFKIHYSGFLWNVIEWVNCIFLFVTTCQFGHYYACCLCRWHLAKGYSSEEREVGTNWYFGILHTSWVLPTVKRIKSMLKYSFHCTWSTKHPQVAQPFRG